MSVSALLSFLKDLDNEHIIAFLGEMQIAEYIHSPWFFGGMGALAICCLVFKWRLLLATIVGLTGLAGLLSYMAEQGAEVSEGIQNNTLIFFILGAISIVALMIYIVFIKEE